jgi:hypothetical protein
MVEGMGRSMAPLEAGAAEDVELCLAAPESEESD